MIAIILLAAMAGAHPVDCVAAQYDPNPANHCTATVSPQAPESLCVAFLNDTQKIQEIVTIERGSGPSKIAARWIVPANGAVWPFVGSALCFLLVFGCVAASNYWSDWWGWWFCLIVLLGIGSYGLAFAGGWNFACHSTTPNRFPENVQIGAVVTAKLEFRDIERQIFA